MRLRGIPARTQDPCPRLALSTGEATGKPMSDSRTSDNSPDGTLDIEHTPKHENDHLIQAACTATFDE